MFLKLITPPSVEPISLPQAKEHLAIDGSEWDTWITAFITRAREYAETECQRVFLTQGWQLVLDAFPGPSLTGVPAGVPFSVPGHAVLIDRNPVQAVTSIQYLDMGGAWQTMTPGDYVAELQSSPARITPAFGKIWPITLPQIGAVKINFTAGYGSTAADVPEGIKGWMLIRLATLFANREEVAIMGRGKIEPLPYVDRLLDGYRTVVM